MLTDEKFDSEKGYVEGPVLSPAVSTEAVILERPKFFTKLNHFLSRIGGEERGIERVHSHERTDQHPFDNFSVWMSANLTVSTFSLGIFSAEDDLFMFRYARSCDILHGVVGFLPYYFLLQFDRDDSPCVLCHLWS
jgi:hypothetical protein